MRWWKTRLWQDDGGAAGADGRRHGLERYELVFCGAAGRAVRAESVYGRKCAEVVRG